MRHRPLGLPGARCVCGAHAEAGRRCVKCRARARWVRRKAHPRSDGGDQLTNDDPNSTNDEQAVMRPTIPVMLFATADAIARGLPEPLSVHISARFGLDVEVATHAELRVWTARLSQAVQPSDSQPFIRYDGALCELTNVYGTWRGTRTNLHCCEPVDTMAALPDEVDP